MDDGYRIDIKKDIHTYAAVTNNAFYTKNKHILNALLQKSLKTKRDKYSFVDLQFEILREVIAANSARKTYSRWKGLMARALSGLAKRQSPQERLARAQKRMEFLEISEMAARLLLGQIRSIGDGLAWWFLDYDRPTLRLLSEHEYISPPEIGRGLYTEIYECAKLLERGQSFLLNSITNCLRYGDITTFNRETDTVQLIEVKAGKLQTPRTIRQKENLTAIQEGLQTGDYPAWAGQSIKRITTDKPPKTYVKIFEKALLEAQQKFASSRVFGDYMSFAVFYIRDLSKLPEGRADVLRTQILDRCWSISRDKNDMVIPFMSNVLTTTHFSRMIAPYTIFPIAEDLRFALMTGDYLVNNLININGLGRWLKNRGWETEILKPPEKINIEPELPFLPILRAFPPGSRKGVEIGPDLLCCAAFELWMPELFETYFQTDIVDSVPNSFSSVCFTNSGKYAWD